MKFCKEKDVEIKSPQEVTKSKKAIVNLINAYIVRNMLEDDEFFALIERDDEITKKAVEFLSK